MSHKEETGHDCPRCEIKAYIKAYSDWWESLSLDQKVAAVKSDRMLPPGVTDEQIRGWLTPKATP